MRALKIGHRSSVARLADLARKVLGVGFLVQPVAFLCYFLFAIEKKVGGDMRKVGSRKIVVTRKKLRFHAGEERVVLCTIGFIILVQLFCCPTAYSHCTDSEE